MAAVAVGLVGAGSRAAAWHAPLLAAGPDTRLAGVWAPREAAARALAEQHATQAYDDVNALFDVCEAVAFAVPPVTQAEIGARAARAGKALLLDAPLSDELTTAVELADAVAEASVPTLMMLPLRYAHSVRVFLSRASTFGAIGGRGWHLSGAHLSAGRPPTSNGANAGLAEIGPHILDLVDGALGEVQRLRAHASPGGWFGLQLEHAGGALSDVSLTARAALRPAQVGVAIYRPDGDGELTVAAPAEPGEEVATYLRSAIAAIVHSGQYDHPLGIARGLHLQRLIDAAVRGLG